MQHVLLYSDSLSWGIVPGTRQRLPFAQRWAGVMEAALLAQGCAVRVIEDCLNGRTTVLDDPVRAGRNGLQGLAQRIEAHSPLALVILMLGTNDFQTVFEHNARDAAQGVAQLVATIRRAPIEPGMPSPPVLIVVPPLIRMPAGAMTEKFAGAADKAAGLAQAYQDVAEALGCALFDANTITEASRVDGIHLDADQHLALGNAMAHTVRHWLARPNPHHPTVASNTRR
ncbi:SGNH/GDSL hydrolase family protein [Ralstonia insidiosa]|uniref:SGNH/GDSL hydrolase family protein n=1 Tax=Ralstonia insidiosa TaxID=190721 RepID=A0A848NY78_9RALS|nr:SGNH/GDSL hydrolase family protein [Ralstonia insidiosa]NMV36418.1 SGNH/GDSL hydrolase family protein [Ralstonia insidiosa]